MEGEHIKKTTQINLSQDRESNLDFGSTLAMT